MSFHLLDRFSTVASRYDVVLCDIWGVVHDGIAAHAQACDALMRYRADGGTVVLITNAPRPSPWVVHQLGRLGVRLTPVVGADYVVCSGLFDDTKETSDDYRDLMATIRGRGLFMVCANPDLIVERGDERVYCAGAIADLYAAMGGEVLYAGKPHRPIYDAALAKAAGARGAGASPGRTLAIGDSLRTDMTGAQR